MPAGTGQRAGQLSSIRDPLVVICNGNNPCDLAADTLKAKSAIATITTLAMEKSAVRRDESASRRISAQSEKIVGARNECHDRIALRQGGQVGVIHEVHVVKRNRCIPQNPLKSCFAQLPHVGADCESVLLGGSI